MRLAPALCFSFCFLTASPTLAAATLVIDDNDPAGAGLNDATPFTPVGGNTATTLGAARLGVFQRAAALWGGQLTSPVPIHVGTQFTSLSCTKNAATLAQTGAMTVHRNFPFAPLADTWYPQALANALAQTDLDPTEVDIITSFNSDIGGPNCLQGVTWYLGFDANPGSGQLDMLTTVLHELAHGLGFQTFENVQTGAEFNGLPDVFLHGIREQGATPTALTDMTDAQRVTADVSDPNLYWSGANVDGAASSLTAGLISGHVRLYAPSTVSPGSSVSHYSTAVSPNELMEPAYTGPNHDLRLTTDLLRDLGWPVPASPTVPATPGLVVGLLGAALLLAAVSRLRRASSRCVPGPAGARNDSVADGEPRLAVRVGPEGAQ